MAIFKVISKNYNTESDVTNLITYILNPEKIESNIFGVRNLYLYQNHNMTAKMLMDTNQYYGKTQGSILHHFVLSYSGYENYINKKIMIENTNKLVDSFLFGHQCIYALHENTDNLHVHIIFNSVNCLTGMKFPLKQEIYEKIVNFLDCITYCEDYKGKRKCVHHMLLYSS